MASATVAFARLYPNPAMIVKRVVGLVLIGIASLNITVFASTGHSIEFLIWPDMPVYLSEKMSPATAFGVMLAGIAFFSTSGRMLKPRVYVYAATAGLCLSFLAIAVFAFDASSLHIVTFYASMSLPTALCLFVLFSTMLMKRADWGWLALLLEEAQGSANARRMLPWLAGFPFFLILTTGLASNAGYLDEHFESSLLTVAIVIILFVIVLSDARGANRLERRVAAEQQRLEQAQEAEREARAARVAAESAVAMRHSFLANMSHEIRTPMNGVMGFAELLLTTELDRKQREYVEIICESGQSMVNILNDILDLAKIESGTLQMVVAPADPRHLAQSTVRLMRAAADRKGLKLYARIEEDVPASLLLDKLRVKQVLSNLVGNAIKFTQRGEVRLSVRVITRGTDEIIEFSVRDTGIGIPANRKAAIFDQFVRADNAAKIDHDGVGLGLPISRNLAEMMGGTLTLESEEGEGTIVRLQLPITRCVLRSGDKIETENARVQANTTEIGVSRILVAEDQNVNQLLVQNILQNLGYETELAQDGIEAVERALSAKASGHPFDLVLMDVQMPKMGGLEATRQIRAMGILEDSLPIVALTAFAYQKDVEDCLAAGMQDHIAKPVKPADMLAKVNFWLKGRPDQTSAQRAG